MYQTSSANIIFIIWAGFFPSGVKEIRISLVGTISTSNPSSASA